MMGEIAAPRRRPADRHRRQPALRGPGGDPRGDAAPARRRGAGGRARRGASRSATGPRRSPLRLPPPGPGDTVLVAGKGHETGPGDRRRRAPLRRPRRAARARWRRAMIALTLGEVAAVGRRHAARRRSRHASSPAAVEYDSRQVGPGGLFLALPGERVDGHDFVGDGASQQGAVAVLCTAPGRRAAHRGGRRHRRADRAGRRRGAPAAGDGRSASPARPARPRPRT